MDDIAGAIRRGEYRFAANRLYELYSLYNSIGLPNYAHEYDIATILGAELIPRIIHIKERAAFIAFYSRVFEFMQTQSNEAQAVRNYIISITPEPVQNTRHRYKGKEKVSERLNRDRTQLAQAFSDIYKISLKPGAVRCLSI